MHQSSILVTLHTVQTSLPAITPFLVPYKRLWGANYSSQTIMSSSTCGTGSQRSPGNFTRQPFTALCGSGTGPILLTYRYWFPFLGLRLICFLIYIQGFCSCSRLPVPNLHPSQSRASSSCIPLVSIISLICWYHDLLGRPQIPLPAGVHWKSLLGHRCCCILKVLYVIN